MSGQCLCLTARGARCKNKAKEGSDYCYLHIKCAKNASESSPTKTVKKSTVKKTSAKKSPTKKTTVKKGGYYETLTVPQLKDLLREKGLKVGGKKADLILRIRGKAETVKKTTKKSVVTKKAKSTKKSVSNLSLHDLRMEMWKKGLSIQGSANVLSKRLDQNVNKIQIHFLKDLENPNVLSVPAISFERDGSYQTLFGYLGTPAKGPYNASDPKDLPILSKGEILTVFVRADKNEINLLPNEWFKEGEKISLLYSKIPGGHKQRQLYINRGKKWVDTKK